MFRTTKPTSQRQPGPVPGGASYRGDIMRLALFMDSRLVRIFCANLPSQQARGASYNLLLSLRKGYLFRHRSWCYRLSSSSTSPESIKSLRLMRLHIKHDEAVEGRFNLERFVIHSNDAQHTTIIGLPSRRKVKNKRQTMPLGIIIMRSENISRPHLMESTILRSPLLTVIP